MTKRISCAALIALPLALLAPSVQASEDDPDLFGALGKFVLDGLGPARTMEDVQREERQAAAAKAQAEKARDEAAAKAEPVSVSVVQPAAPPPEPEPEYVSAPVVHAPVKVEPARVAVPEVKAAIIPPPPRARPAEVVRAAPPVVNLPPPEPLKSHIAATATVDQAIKLGGPSGLYGRRLMVD